MHISSLEEYGLRCALQLARNHGGKPLPASKIAEEEKISVEYVSKLMHLLRKSGLVDAARGIQGGFKLSREPSEISLKDVFESLKEKKNGEDSPAPKDMFCSRFSGQQNSCVHMDSCSIRPFWKLIDIYFTGITQEITLAALLVDEHQVSKQIEALAHAQAHSFKEFYERVSHVATV